MSPTPDVVSGQWLKAPDGVRWFFESGELCLDFGYTGNYGYGVAEWEQLHEPADLEAWLVERFKLRGPEADLTITQREFQAALRLRTAICLTARALSEGRTADPTDVDRINSHAIKAGVPQLIPGGTMTPPLPTATAMLATIAHDAVEVFTELGERVRQCQADNCALVYFDSSRGRTRRWCSMKRCGNRAKARTHYARGNM